MVTPHSRILYCSLIGVASLLLCQCETTRTVKSTRSSFSFDDQMWGGQGGGDSDKIRSKFAERGYSINEDGTIKANKSDLYKGDKPRGFDGEFGTKKAKFRKTEARTNAFKTPEYLKMQDYAGVTNARESGNSARENDKQKSRNSAAGKLFASKTEKTSALTTFDTGAAAESGDSFATGGDRVGNRAIESAPIADGPSQTAAGAGYTRNSSLTVDDVRKILSPGTYADARNLD